ncbi:type II secretion system protein GspL [Alloalcanivorax mobilis]|uniref:type II secretion system protein GspL n=1 Tax=Alloalcanivorax mobilis TaxID=2019569 RepID=UPI000B5B128F|nr:type II secretion system protein GspL [Alloalcanivorax mobilis]ASK33839.1 general secretion pathway protein GspL [Alcanivorax sp. N3-2A]
MADTALIYLAPGAFKETLAEAGVLLQTGAGQTPREMTLSEALAAVHGGTVSVVLTSTEALLTGVTLSRKQARHLQRVLPFLLEEQLLEAPESLWFAAGKSDHGRYPVAVVGRAPLEGLLMLCREHQVRPLTLKADADLLQADAPLIIGVDRWGAMILDREQALVADAAQRDALMALRGGEQEPAAEEFTHLEDALSLCERLRAALAAGQGVEMLQGPYVQRQNQKTGPSPWAPWKPVIGLAAAVFVLALVAVWTQQWRYNQAADQSFAEAAKLYQTLFPGDRATAGLRRQFEARLARLSSGGGETGGALFALLPAVASTLNASEVEPKRLQFDQRDGSLLLDLGAKEYSQLEKLQTALREKGVNATIANYRNGASGVTARVKVEQAG